MDTLRRQFAEKGYVVIETDVDPEICERIKESLAPQFAVERRIMNYWKHNSDVRTIALDLKVFEILRHLYRANPRPFQTLNFDCGTEQGLHSDAMHFNSDPPGMMCGVWVALEDVTERNGPLLYCPGSHRLPFYCWSDTGLATESRPDLRSGAYSDWIIEKTASLVQETALLSRGEAMVWAANLLHGGSRILDPGSSRWSQVTHYFFEGTERFVTPLLDCSRQPEWIPGWVTGWVTG